MVTGRVHRMTELFARLRPGSISRGRARRAPGPSRRHRQGTSRGLSRPRRFPDRRRRPPRPAHVPGAVVLLVLLAAAALVFVIACSNVANLILARAVRREGELAIRASLGATTGALRRTLLAESLILCGAGPRSAC
jgi:hypothetical protein